MSRQKFGVNAIGEHVARDFGEDGIFTGTITRFTRGKNGVEDLYQVTYTDGDVEELDVPEYNFGYALHLQNEGWEVESARSVSSDDSTNDADKTQTYRPSKVHANTTLHFRQFTPPCSNLFFFIVNSTISLHFCLQLQSERLQYAEESSSSKQRAST